MSKYKRDLRDKAREFAEQCEGAFSTTELARWALAEGKVQREAGYADRLVEQRLAREFAAAMREDYARDPQGRLVREMYSARIKGKPRWLSRKKSTRDFMEQSFSQQRGSIIGHCHHLKIDCDSFNENRSPDNPIQLVFDFTNDLAELEAMAEDHDETQDAG